TVLLEAAKQLISEDFEFELRVHGAAPFQSESFVADIDRLFAETSPSVQRRGAYRREDIAGLIATVDCAIMPSIWWENAPLVIQEAQSQDCPVITSNIGGMAEMIEDGVNGLTVPTNDPIALAAAMRRIAEDADLRQTLVLGARHPDTIDMTAARYLDLIETLRPAHVEAA
ncbi:glycosyltransferase, partial [Phyllobacterium sp. P5_D12]